MEQGPFEAIFPQLDKKILYFAFDGIRSFITVLAKASHLSDGSTYV
jgi:hypothetical protein